ncbi:hypothetical protein A3F00_02980 [Candidatus Daviesbacteria bacterium RIFCSPHIGHO2_12_FULL_37_11]|uniref:Glycosyltransferase RgtA/B/C/D-like domain-containing protein n=1 Tax=Candidatus Daviesbacteria bacterium RIFCSPHIGHO2_12_FULL_37_11 TaxID=1797777 RepID=A0A1F5KBR9_9BACT|nr:MAG: hypothetical protein A2769_04270 [Candidatus Daviesbacteria bacterium RIFCSPHIGHO2_01_FULL_37_27]OGE38264.1 MAG: hypothetical protein A3F00_02980 [Candidatus Daviesbacteria bacterium RIFCSPHIGHO2_12_FULL_37_11]OGE46221.1 MAG: hypothetical protein A3B39_02745 [Candidatus Daviesbacteria bacterium RIFCSPLOWO2_01_FULL_37_10]
MIWIILLAAFVLRLININQSLWLDEAINVLSSQNFSFWDMVTKYPVGDFHPPGYFALLWIWTRIGGIGEIWVRLPSVFFGVVTVWLVYLIGKEMFSKRVGMLGAFFMAIAPLHVYYSQEARMYSLVVFSVTLSFYFFWRLISRGDKGNLGDRIVYGMSNVLVLYSDYLIYLIIPSQLIFILLFRRDTLKRILIPLVFSLSVIIPWLFIFQKQLAIGTAAASALPGWANIVGGASAKELLLIPVKTFFGRVSIENNQIYTLAAGSVGFLYGLLIFKGLKKLDNATKLLLCWISIPVSAAFFISFFIPVLSYFRMVFILPPVYLLLAKDVNTLRSRETPWKLGTGVICLISLISLYAYYTNPKFQREDWRSAVKMVDELAIEDGLIVFENDNLPAPFIYYSKNKSPAMGGLNKVPAINEDDIKIIPNIENIYLFEYLVDITDPKRLLQKNIVRREYKEVETLNFNGVGFVRHYRLR